MDRSKGLVYIDGGDDEGFMSGAMVCFIFYDRDDGFPARGTRLFGLNPARSIDFEVWAVRVTLFVHFLTKP